MEKGPQPHSAEYDKRISRLIERLREKQSWKSEIPNEILSGASPIKDYKVRKNWWSGLAQDFYSVKQILADSGNTSLLPEIDQFFITFGTDEFYYRPTTKEDIEKAEMLINKVILELENSQNIT